MITKKERNPDIRAIDGVYRTEMGESERLEYAPPFFERLRKRLQSFFPWFFAPRRTYLPNTVISLTSGQGIAPGQGLFDPIHRTWQVPVLLYGIDRNSSVLGDYESERWLCEQYREIPSRWESLKTRIAWYWEYLSCAYFARSDKSVLESMRKREHKV